MTKDLIRKIASRFLETSCYHGQDIIDEGVIDDADNYLLLDEVFIGSLTRQRRNKLFKEGGMIRHSIILYLELQSHSIGKV